MDFDKFQMSRWGSILNRFHFADPLKRFVVHLPPNAQVLDFGCGDGQALRRLLQLRPDLEATAVDVQDHSRSQFLDGVTFLALQHQTNLKSLFPTKFDAIICKHVIEHLTVEQAKAMAAEFYGVLKDGGIIYLETPSTKSLCFPSLAMYSRKGGPLNFFDDHTHIRPYTPVSLEAIFSPFFKILKIKPYRNTLIFLASPILLLWGILSRRALVLALHHLFGWAVYMIAKLPHETKK